MDNSFYTFNVLDLEEKDLSCIKYLFRHTFRLRTQNIDDYVRYAKMVCRFAIELSDSPDMINAFVLLGRKIGSFSNELVTIGEDQTIKEVYRDIYNNYKKSEEVARLSLSEDYELLKTDKEIYDLWNEFNNLNKTLRTIEPVRVLISEDGDLNKFKRYILDVLMTDINGMKISVESYNGSPFMNSRRYCNEAAVAFNSILQTLVYAINCYSNRPGNDFLQMDWIYINAGLGDVDRILKRCEKLEVE